MRDAYRRLARERHPDRTGGDDGSMAALNVAYRVLGDPERRAAYDASLRAAVSGSAAGRTTTPTSTRVTASSAQAVTRPTGRLVSGPVRFPWKPVVVAAVAGTAGVVTVAAFTKPSGPAPPDGVLEAGSCVVLVDSDHTAREIACDGTARYRVRTLVALDDGCPGGTVGYREVEGQRTACVELIPDA